MKLKTPLTGKELYEFLRKQGSVKIEDVFIPQYSHQRDIIWKVDPRGQVVKSGVLKAYSSVETVVAITGTMSGYFYAHNVQLHAFTLLQ